MSEHPPQQSIEVTPVILCGGSGTRLWPLSRTGFPKQFLCLSGDESLFQMAARRLRGLAREGLQLQPLLIVTGEEHRFLALEQLREAGVPLGAALLEPQGRNTAPALTLAALSAMASGSDPVLVVTPADQSLQDEAAFTRALHCAIAQASEGAVVILGITPESPETGYGYIQAGQPAAGHHTGESMDANSLPVLRFVEKPDLPTAQRYLAEGQYFWNAGMFVLRASVWLQALQLLRPDILQATRSAWLAAAFDTPPSSHSPGSCFVRPDKAAFAAVPAESIDYAVMEHLPGTSVPIRMVPLSAGWSDLGAWEAVWNVQRKDPTGNALHGDVLVHESKHNLVHASSRLVSLVGVDHLIVVETPDAVLVADKTRSQEVRHIVDRLQHHKRHEPSSHRKVHRPWGWYDSLDTGERFKVKRIQVNPGASLSLQKHHHRAEHWVVVRGTAAVTVGEQTVLVSENQSTFIPLGQTHRLANPGKVPLEIIEVQSGSYLGEDDIVRLKDSYGRD